VGEAGLCVRRQRIAPAAEAGSNNYKKPRKPREAAAADSARHAGIFAAEVMTGWAMAPRLQPAQQASRGCSCGFTRQRRCVVAPSLAARKNVAAGLRFTRRRNSL
jgi:hypothetical protein